MNYDSIKLVVLEEVVRVDNTECPSGTRSWKRLGTPALQHGMFDQ